MGLVVEEALVQRLPAGEMVLAGQATQQCLCEGLLMERPRSTESARRSQMNEQRDRQQLVLAQLAG